MREAVLTASPGSDARELDDLERAFQAFLAEGTGSVLRVARRLMGDEEAARDLSQDALLKAHQRLATFRGEASLKTWVIRITVNEGLKRLRRRRLKDRVTGWLRAGQAPPAGYGLARPASPEREAGLREQMEILVRVMDQLPARQRTVLVLRYLEGLGIEEIAEVLGVGPGTVKTHLVRAVRRVREASKA
jgi:RNA polymerase sigma-70 factor (ECF subfamily)